MTLSAYLLLIPLAFTLPKYLKWYYSHIEIDGKQLEFEYEGPWWGVIGWLLFSVITIGLGSFYAVKRITQFTVAHTRVVGEDGKESSFDGSAWGILGWSLVTSLSVYLLFIPLVFLIVSTNRWYNSHTMYSGKQLTFKHDGPWWGVLGWALFSVITFGIGSFYAQKKEIQWTISHTHFVEQA